MGQRDYRYCPYCATPLDRRVIFLRERPVCPSCGFVHFRDPKVAVIGMVTWGEHILLIRRDVEPMRGFWALPGGYMDAGEMPAAALERELFEEVGLEVEVGDLIEIFPMVGPGGPSGGIVLAFRVGVESTAMPELACNDDVCESAWFGPDNLPSELAFESTITLLERWRDASR